MTREESFICAFQTCSPSSSPPPSPCLSHPYHPPTFSSNQNCRYSSWLLHPVHQVLLAVHLKQIPYLSFSISTAIIYNHLGYLGSCNSLLGDLPVTSNNQFSTQQPKWSVENVKVNHIVVLLCLKPPSFLTLDHETLCCWPLSSPFLPLYLVSVRSHHTVFGHTTIVPSW